MNKTVSSMMVVMSVLTPVFAEGPENQQWHSPSAAIAPNIDSFFYTTSPLQTNDTEILQLTLTESQETWHPRTYQVEVDIIRPNGWWTVASHSVTVPAGQSRHTHSFNLAFNQPGEIITRVLVFNADKSTLLAERKGKFPDTIEVANNDIIPNVPYFWQLDNVINPYGSCQNTSIAMVLNYYGASTTPDAISSYWGTRYAQTLDGLRTVFNTDAAYHGLSVRMRSTPFGNLARINQNLADGKPVIVHGYTTGYGHVIVLVGFDGTHYYAHDPYGRWDQIPYSSGYFRTASAGQYVKYSQSSFEAAFAPDGFIWLHEVD